MSKFPSEIHLRAAHETSKDVQDIDDVLRVIKQDVEARETSEGIRVNPNKAILYSIRVPANSNPFVTNSNTV